MQPIDLSTPCPKAADSFDRTTPLAQTLALMPYLRRRFAIDRVADLMLLDRMHIPVFSAVVARSLDAISTYNGKGVTSDQALVGAVMEAVERQAAADVSLPTVTDLDELDAVLDPVRFGILTEAYDRRMPFVAGFDLMNGKTRHVPLAAVQTPWRGPAAFGVTSTSGLAAGIGIVEATYHALFELVERHLFSIAQARGHALPRIIIGRLTGSNSGPWVDRMIDNAIGNAIARPTGDPLLDELCERIDRAGLTLKLTTYEEAPLPILALATIVETQPSGGRAHLGMGCSWSPRHALRRALTEAAQSRLTDTSGAREDIFIAADATPSHLTHLRRTGRIPHGRWYYDVTKESRALASINDLASDDLAKDVRALLAVLRSIGVHDVVAVDITPAHCAASVVRVIAPQLESAFADGRIGPAIASILSNPQYAARKPDLL